MTHPYRYWLALHPDIPRPLAEEADAPLAEALNNLGREARIIQENAAFHPGWFSSDVNTISYPEFRSNTDSTQIEMLLFFPRLFCQCCLSMHRVFQSFCLIKMGRTVLESKMVMVSRSR